MKIGATQTERSPSLVILSKFATLSISKKAITTFSHQWIRSSGEKLKKREKTLIKNGHIFITKPETRTIVPRISPKRQSHGCKADLFCGSQGSQTKSSRRNSSGKVVVHQHAQNMRSTVAKGANVANTGVDASELQTSGTDLAEQ